MMTRKLLSNGQTIVVIAVCLFCLALRTTQSASPGQVKGAQKQQTKTATPREPQPSSPAQVKRASPAANGSVKTPRATAKSRQSQDGPSSKFQARMMHSDLASAQSQESPYSSAMDGPQSWQPNESLAPTFTDQEQGDEMVALASDSVEPEQVAPPQSSQDDRQRPGSRDYPAREGPDQAFVERPPPGEQAGTESRQAKISPTPGRPSPNIDEYYNDEEEDEDEPPKLSEFEPIELKERPNSGRYHPADHADHFSDDQPPAPLPFEEGSRYSDRVPEQAAGNRSSAARLPAASTNQDDSGWQPKDVYPAQAKPESHSGSQQPRAQQQSDGKHSSTAKRLASLLSGGRDSLGAFSRADVAIEYLRNMLKNKQQSLLNNNHTYSDSNSKQQFDSSITDKNISLQRLSSFTSRLNQIFQNTTNSSDASAKNGSNATSSKAGPKELDSKKAANSEAKDVASQPDLTEPKSFLSQAGTKFSIGDAKPPAGSLKSQADNTSPAPTTKQPYPGNPAPSDHLYSHYQQDQSFVGGSPNGTPLGGDYIESQDEFPRGSVARPPYQNPLLPSLVGAESQQIPMKAYQESRFSEHIPINQAGPSSLRQPIGVSPVSSTYFQMHQLPPVAAPAYPNLAAQSGSLSPAFSEVHKTPLKDSPSPYHQQIKHAPQKSELASNQTLHEEDQKRPIRPLHVEKPQVVAQQKYAGQQAVRSEQPSGIQPSMSSSKLYRNANEQASPPIVPPIGQPNQHPQQERKQQPANIPAPPPQKQIKPPKIVSYNYFESPNDPDVTETNYQLGDALYSSNGGMEHLLSGAELEAIQSQFMTLEHPVVPMGSAEQQINAQIHHQEARQQQNLNYQAQDPNLAGLLASLKPSFITPEGLQKLSSPEKQAEESLKELASQEQPTSVRAPPSFDQAGNREFERGQTGVHKNLPRSEGEPERGQQSAGKVHNGEPADARKKKSLIVYLNHPRPNDMSKAAQSTDDYNIAHSIGDQPNEPTFVSAKEFDSHGLSKDTKHLDVSNLHGLGEIKDGQDKDGLSVVVIGDAYKYKKIVLLISSKSGGLKFIPMVKDMKK